jgi:ATP-binding cassette subfamily B protein
MANQPPTNPPGAISTPGQLRGSVAKIEKARDSQGTIRRLAAYLKPYKSALLLVFIFVILNTILSLLGPYLMGQAIDGYIVSGDVAGLMRVSLLILGSYLGAWLTSIIQAIIMATISQKALRRLRVDLFEHLQRLSLSFFDRYSSGDLMSRFTNDLDALSRVLSQNVTELFAGLLTLAGIFIAVFALNFWLALGTMLVFPLMLGLVGYVGKRTRTGFRLFQKNLGLLNGQLEEMISGQRVILAFGQEATALAEFDRANETVRESGVQAQVYATLVPPMMGILSNINIAVVAGLGGWMVLHGWATVGVIAAFINYSRNFAAPLRQIGNLYNQLQAALAGAERVFATLDLEPELPDAPTALPLVDIAGEVIFKDVSFNYVPGVPVIKHMNLRAEPGQTIALVGPTGAGKTTIINLLTRFYDVDAGSIEIDGHDIRSVQKASLRRQLGIVLQDTFLFSDTVLENIRYGRLEASDEDCIAAARLADADSFIRRLPQGYRTLLSEQAHNLSQGQRQLLAISRAILADPKILILDEATSSVDTRTEMRIQAALLRLMRGRTSFVIAHRLSTIRDADQVLVINDGQIIEQGNHDELLARKGFYARLYWSQFKGRLAPSSFEEVVGQSISN